MKVPTKSRIALSVTSAILLLLAFTPFELWPLGWFALVPFFLMVQVRHSKSNFLLGYLSGVIFFSGLLWWLNHVTSLGYLALALFLALYFGVAALLIGIVRSALRRALAMGALWMVLEFIRSKTFIAFSWGCLAHSQYRNLAFIQAADLVGVYGLTALMATTSGILGFGVLHRRNGRLAYKPALILLAVLLVVYGYGLYQLNRPCQGRVLSVALAQGNVPQDIKWDYRVEQDILANYLELTNDAVGHGAKLVVWPETALPSLLEQKQDFEIQLRNLCAQKSFYLLFGALHGEVVSDGGRYYNSAFLVTPEDASSTLRLSRYDKIHLVPFGEYVPFARWIPFVERIVEDEGGGGLSHGQMETVFNVDSTKIAALVCFESTLPQVARRFTRQGIQGLIVITNDEWFKRSPASIQHAIQSVFRAIENRVPVIRSTNTGLTCSIDLYGRIRKRYPRFQMGVLEDDVLFPNEGKTFYTRHGDWLAWLGLVYVIAIIGLEICEMLKARKSCKRGSTG